MGSTEAPWFCRVCCQKVPALRRRGLRGEAADVWQGNSGLFLGSACSSCSSRGLGLPRWEWEWLRGAALPVELSQPVTPEGGGKAGVEKPTS